MGSKPRADLSPMIDLVFLILIFFMIASTAIRFKTDPNVEIPTADRAKVAEMIDGRGSPPSIPPAGAMSFRTE